MNRFILAVFFVGLPLYANAVEITSTGGDVGASASGFGSLTLSANVFASGNSLSTVAIETMTISAATVGAEVQGYLIAGYRADSDTSGLSPAGAFISINGVRLTGCNGEDCSQGGMEEIPIMIGTNFSIFMEATGSEGGGEAFLTLEALEPIVEASNEVLNDAAAPLAVRSADEPPTLFFVITVMAIVIIAAKRSRNMKCAR